ncbi:GNAT family N-acetyltransferase [Dokdonella sp.]|uniref:GNAT family N-acetyltransferase n=1 Tax=Dokdonella sp. TaxID=2291710 RepID=UPI0031C2A6FA|nr:GNAT family N-acetyltransferase [Dokdonella sp.]
MTTRAAPQIPVIVREATPADHAFLVDCNLAMARETEGRLLDRATLQRGIAGVLGTPSRGFYLVAENGGGAAGCVLVTREWSDWRNGDWWWLQSVYVLPAARRHGVFRALHAAVRERARARPDVVGLRLYVERDNRVAQATYGRLGLLETIYRMLEDEFEPGGGGHA